MQAKVIEIGSLIAMGITLKAWIDNFLKIIEPAVKEAERQALDGEITASDRIKVAWSFVYSLEAEKKIKLNIFNKWIIGKLINVVANSLPNFTITKRARQNELAKSCDKEQTG